MLKAGALLYTMFLIIVIAIISSSFVLLNYYNSTYIISVIKQEQQYQDVESGINYALSFYQEIPLNTSINIDLFGDEEHPIELERKNWGAFQIITTKSIWRNKKKSKTVLIGGSMNGNEKIALYLADQNKPLSLTGKTKITGDCYLPKSGVKRAFIEGESFVGNKLINGIKHNSNKSLPPINKELIQVNQDRFSLSKSITDSVIDYELIMDQDSIINSFQNKTLIVYAPFSIELDYKTIDGNVIIKSDKNIHVKSTTKITDALLYAKGIVIDNNVSSNLQAFAEDSIIIGENVQLNYPSFLGLLGTGKSTSPRKISINKNTSISGSIILINEFYDRKNQALISIEKDCSITGQVYSSELLELKGEIIGEAYCKKLLLKTASSVYENHLMDATINRTELSEYFIGIPLERNAPQQIIKCLN